MLKEIIILAVKQLCLLHPVIKHIHWIGHEPNDLFFFSIMITRKAKYQGRIWMRRELWFAWHVLGIMTNAQKLTYIKHINFNVRAAILFFVNLHHTIVIESKIAWLPFIAEDATFLFYFSLNLISYKFQIIKEM